MTRTVPETDWRGHFIMSSQVWTTARDLARLGLLYLNDGMWDGRAAAAGGLAQLRRAARPGPAAERLWLWRQLVDISQGQTACPQDAIVARGNRGQYVVVIPSRKLVIVRRGFDGNAMNFDLDAFTRDLLATLN